MPNDSNNEKIRKIGVKIEKVKLYGPPPDPRINLGKYFLKLIDKHFKHDNKLNKIFNSYSCTKNIFQIINNYNKEIIKDF